MKLKRAYIEITNACNLSCPFCVQRHDQARYLDPERFSDILKQVKPFTSYVYLHVLGEPLSHPQLEELLALCAGEEMKVQLTTNGTLLRSRKDLLRKYPPRQINVSVHAFPHARCDLEDVLPSNHFSPDWEYADVGKVISEFLREEKEDSRNVFIRKYYFFDSISDIAQRYSFTESKVKNKTGS